jgi:hypothetical protein
MQRNKPIGCQTKKSQMQTRTSYITLSCFILLNLIFSGCKKPAKECISYSTAYVTDVAGPNMIPVNQETDFVLKCYLNSGCGKFEKLESTADGYEVTVKIGAKYTGCICTDNLIGGEFIYKFKPAQTGTYTLRFVQPDKTLLTKTITVN